MLLIKISAIPWQWKYTSIHFVIFLLGKYLLKKLIKFDFTKIGLVGIEKNLIHFNNTISRLQWFSWPTSLSSSHPLALITYVIYFQLLLNIFSKIDMCVILQCFEICEPYDSWLLVATIIMWRRYEKINK